MSEDTTEIRIYDILFSLIKHKFIIIALMIAGMAAGTFLAGAKFYKGMNNPVYTAKASMVFNSETQEGIYAVAGSEIPTQSDFTLSNYLVDTAAYIAKSQSVYYGIVEALNSDMSYETYRQAVSVTKYEETSILMLSVTTADKVEAVLIANEIEAVLPGLLQGILGLGSVSVIDRAETAVKSDTSINVMLIALGAVGGGMMGAGLIALLAILHPTFMDSEFIEEVVKTEVFAEIPNQRIQKGRNLPLTVMQMTGAYLQSFDLLAIKLVAAAEKHDQKSIMITSAGAAEGKTSITIHLGQALARRGYKVLLVDSDRKNPSIGKKYGIGCYRKNSLNAVANNEIAVEQAPLNISDNLYVIHCYESEEMLYSSELNQRLFSLKGRYDFILYDTSPSGLIADAFHMKDIVDGVLFVIRQGTTPVEEIKKICISYEHVGIPFVGCVLNAVQKRKKNDKNLNKYYSNEIQ